jgi:transposase
MGRARWPVGSGDGKPRFDEVAGLTRNEVTKMGLKGRAQGACEEGPAMDHVAIDIGGRESQICARSADGSVLEEKRVRTADLPKYFAGRAAARVVMETCSEAFGLADSALEHGHEVRVVPATLVKALGVGLRGVKTDKKDARVLSEASCRMDLPSVHIASAQSRRLKTICGTRESLVTARTQFINCVRGWLRASARRPRAGASSTFHERVRTLVGEPPTHIERLLEMIEQLTLQIDQADRELVIFAKEDSTCRRLMTVPGVGPVVAIRFLAGIDDASRFESAHRVASYIGLTPGERSSSDKTIRTGITKAGAPKIRWALVQAAWVARRCRKSDPMVIWALEVEKRRGKAIAIVALARKIAVILFAIWRDGTFYDPTYKKPETPKEVAA